MTTASTVPSPCINVCRIHRRSGLCEGCKRSLEEIGRWPTASDAEKRAILAALPGRTIPQSGPLTGLFG